MLTGCVHGGEEQANAAETHLRGAARSEGMLAERLTAQALVRATLALVEEQRTANLIAAYQAGLVYETVTDATVGSLYRFQRMIQTRLEIQNDETEKS